MPMSICRSVAEGVRKHAWAPCLLALLTAYPSKAQENKGELPAPAPVPSPATPETVDRTWRGTLELYGFAPIRSWGTTTIKGFEADVDTSLSELIPLIETVGSARASIENGRFGLMTDLYYAQIGDEITRTGKRGLLTGRVEQTSIQGIYDFAFRYRMGATEKAIGTPGETTVIPYAGVRVLRSQLDLLATLEGRGPLALRLQKQGTWERTWTQGLVGTQASVFLTPGVRLFARGDIGGFGLGGEQDLSGNAQVGLGIALGNNTQLDVSWRYMGLAFSNGADRETGFTLKQNGIEAGLKVFF